MEREKEREGRKKHQDISLPLFLTLSIFLLPTAVWWLMAFLLPEEREKVRRQHGEGGRRGRKKEDDQKQRERGRERERERRRERERERERGR
jgi:hypothetical protein